MTTPEFKFARIKHSFMIHEGGTKMYQVYQITVGTKETAMEHYQPVQGITVTHYRGRWAEHIEDLRPLTMGGQIDTHPDKDWNYAAEIVRQKSSIKKGYKTSILRSMEDQVMTIKRLPKFLIEHFGPDRTPEMMMRLGLLDAVPTDDDDNEGVTAEDLPAAPAVEIERPATWGAW